MGPHCLPMWLLKHFKRREKQTTIVPIGALRAKYKSSTSYFHHLFLLSSYPFLQIFTYLNYQSMSIDRKFLMNTYFQFHSHSEMPPRNQAINFNVKTIS